MRVLTTARAGLICSTLFANTAIAQDFDELKKAIGDSASADWIYEDIDAGYAESKRTGKPLLVTFR